MHNSSASSRRNRFGKANIIFVAVLILIGVLFAFGYSKNGEERNYSGTATVSENAHLPNNKSICEVSVMTPAHSAEDNPFTYYFRSDSKNCYKYTKDTIVEIVEGKIIGIAK